MAEIKNTILELANLKSMRQLEIETAKVNLFKKTPLILFLKNAKKKLGQRCKPPIGGANQSPRISFGAGHATNEKDRGEEIEKCKITAEIMKQFEQNSCSGPFFKCLKEILNNFQGILILRTLFLYFIIYTLIYDITVLFIKVASIPYGDRSNA